MNKSKVWDVVYGEWVYENIEGYIKGLDPKGYSVIRCANLEDSDGNMIFEKDFLTKNSEGELLQVEFVNQEFLIAGEKMKDFLNKNQYVKKIGNYFDLQQEKKNRKEKNVFTEQKTENDPLIKTEEIYTYCKENGLKPNQLDRKTMDRFLSWD